MTDSQLHSWTDSMSPLHWIRSSAKQWFAVRWRIECAVIQNATEPKTATTGEAKTIQRTLKSWEVTHCGATGRSGVLNPVRTWQRLTPESKVSFNTKGQSNQNHSITAKPWSHFPAGEVQQSHHNTQSHRLDGQIHTQCTNRYPAVSSAEDSKLNKDNQIQAFSGPLYVKPSKTKSYIPLFT